MSYQIGETVILNGKDYKIVGTKARSFLLERDGKKYKATADKLDKIKNQNASKASKPTESALQKHLGYRQIFDPRVQLPITEAEYEQWFDGFRNELSPENLHCDGEISHAQAMRKLKNIRAKWRELEARLGRKVAE